MNIVIGVWVSVVMPMVRGPPQRTLLSRTCAEKRKNKLEDATRLIRPVWKISVISSGDSKHASDIEQEAHTDSKRAPSINKREATCQMNGKKWNAGKPGYLFVLYFHGLRIHHRISRKTPAFRRICLTSVFCNSPASAPSSKHSSRIVEYHCKLVLAYYLSMGNSSIPEVVWLISAV